MTIDQMIVEADLAATSLRSYTRPTHAEVQTWAENRRGRDLSRPRRRRHRRTPIEYRMSPAEFVISGTASAMLGGALSVFVTIILFGASR